MGRERSGERKGADNRNLNGQGTAKGEAGKIEENDGDRKRKFVRWWGTRQSTGSPTGEGCRLDSTLTISGTGATGDWSRHSGEWPRPT